MNVDMKPGNRFEQYRFVLQPKWIIGHLIIIATVISFINFGLWQFRRLDEKRTRNSQIEQRLKSPVESLDSLIEPTVEVDDPKVDSLIYRRVRVVGAALHGRAAPHDGACRGGTGGRDRSATSR